MISETYLFNGRTGLFKELHKIENFLAPLKFYVYSVSYAFSSDASYTDANKLSISGAGFTDKEAKEKCIGEAIERYCWYFARYWKDLIQATYNELREEAISPDKFSLFSEAQYKQKKFPYVPFRKDTRIWWVKGRLLNKNEYKYVPAQLCFPTYEIEEALISYPTTTGVACAQNFYEAIFKGICEVIERDAFMIMWLNKIVLKQVDLKKYKDALLSKVLSSLNDKSYRCLIFKLETEIPVHAYLAVVVNKKLKAPHVALGASVDLDSDKAIRKAVLESLHSLNVLFFERLVANQINLVFKDFKAHAILYSNPKMRKNLTFLISPSSEISLRNNLSQKNGDWRTKTFRLVNMISTRGYDVIVVDLTPLSFKKLGIHVVKVLIPGFIDLGLYKFYFLGSKRIYEVPIRLGLKVSDKLNLIPHPFP